MKAVSAEEVMKWLPEVKHCGTMSIMLAETRKTVIPSSQSLIFAYMAPIMRTRMNMRNANEKLGFHGARCDLKRVQL